MILCLGPLDKIGPLQWQIHMGGGLGEFGFPAKMNNYHGAFEPKTREGELDPCHWDLPLV